MSVLNWIVAHIAWIGFAASELVALIPSIKSNSVIQVSVKVLKSVVDALKSVADAVASALNPPTPPTV